MKETDNQLDIITITSSSCLSAFVVYFSYLPPTHPYASSDSVP